MAGDIMFFDWNMNGKHDSSDDLMSFAFFNSMEDEERKKREEQEKEDRKKLYGCTFEITI